MANRQNLIYRLVQIEINNIKNICPFVYKTSDKNIKVNLHGYCLNIDNKCTSSANHHFIQLHNFYPTIDNKIIQNDEVDSPLCLSNVYFVNGYNKYVSILSHIESKYKVIDSDDHGNNSDDDDDNNDYGNNNDDNEDRSVTVDKYI